MPAGVGRTQTMAGTASHQAKPRAGLCLGYGRVHLPPFTGPWRQLGPLSTSSFEAQEVFSKVLCNSVGASAAEWCGVKETDAQRGPPGRAELHLGPGSSGCYFYLYVQAFLLSSSPTIKFYLVFRELLEETVFLQGTWRNRS